MEQISMYDQLNEDLVCDEDPQLAAYQQARLNISSSKKKPALNNYLMPQ